ncbi:MAG TPA: PQQ-dependent sugar dehydrogenase [Tepidisphaeraceae bacterium]
MRNRVVGLCGFLFVIASLRIAAADGGGTPPDASPLPPVRFELVGKVEERPLLVTHDHTGRAFVVEQPGRIWMIRNGKIADGKPFLELADEIYDQGECGLLGLAFHPDFATNGLFYINCIMKSGGKRTVIYAGKPQEQNTIQTVIAEFHADPKSATADRSSMRVVLRIDQPYENHNGGMIAFGPDRMLYIGMGDGGNQRDPSRNGQNLSVLLAKMLRIDVTPRQGYAIPPDNPFVGRASVRPEIWAYGLRNPWRFSFDRSTGLLWAADVGEDRWEEVDIVQKGGNYGWSEREGFYPFDREPMRKGERPPVDPPALHPGFADPVKVYWHDLGQSITGGYVYRGKAIPQLAGWYLYGDYSKGTIWGLRIENGRITGDQVLRISNEKEVRPMLPSGFGEDGDGEIYVCSHQDGKVWKIVPGAK